MALREQIFNDLKEAQKGGEIDVVSVLRLLISSIRNKEIEKRTRSSGEEDVFLDDAEIQKILYGEIKKGKDAINLYLKGKREDLADKEKKEVTILSKYIPPELSESEIGEEALRIIQKQEADGRKDFGSIMKALMGKVGGRADGATVSRIVKELLNKT